MENQGKSQQAQQEGAGAQKPLEIDQFKLERYLREMKENQSFVNGLFGGLAAAAGGAAIWSLITVLTNYQIGWMAVGVGFLVGYGVRIFGKGVDAIFGVMGSALSLLGCLAGNFLAVLIVVSRQESIPFFDLLSRVTPRIAVNVMKVTFHPMDALFYGIALYEGYHFSFRRLTDEDLAKLAK